MSYKHELTLQESARIIFDLMYGHEKKHRDLLNAYSYATKHYEIYYTYEEIKEYLFHNDLSKYYEE